MSAFDLFYLFKYYQLNDTTLICSCSSIMTYINTNALNLFDGIDLQSGSYILIIFVFFFILLNIEFLIILILSCILFLYLNYKREIFLGDSGTILIGFIIRLRLLRVLRNCISSSPTPSPHS